MARQVPDGGIAVPGGKEDAENRTDREKSGGYAQGYIDSQGAER